MLKQNKYLMLIGAIVLIGCSNSSTTPQETHKSSKDLKYNQVAVNVANEKFELLSIKYNLKKETVVGLIGDYEEMTIGVSPSKAVYETVNKVPKGKQESEKVKVLSVPEAVSKLESIYQIPAKRIAEIILEFQALEGHVGE